MKKNFLTSKRTCWTVGRAEYNKSLAESSTSVKKFSCQWYDWQVEIAPITVISHTFTIKLLLFTFYCLLFTQNFSQTTPPLDGAMRIKYTFPTTAVTVAVLRSLTFFLSVPRLLDNYIFRENSRNVDEHFSLFFRENFTKTKVIFRENMVHNKIKT